VSGPAFRHLDEREVHRGRIWNVVVARFASPDGTTFERDVVRSPGAVGVVPILFDAEGSAAVVLLSIYRPALDSEVVEIPAGMRDVKGEAPEATARRELREEIGMEADDVELLTMFHNSAGMTDATTHVYLASGLRKVASDLQGPEENAMTVFELPLADAFARVTTGTITDAKTVIGVLLAWQRLGAD
jgi:8-oxo-dGTP pyrophosphatase MutT (NUDIX family)